MFHFTTLVPSEVPLMLGTFHPYKSLVLRFITILSSNQKKYKKVKCLCFHLVKFTFFYIFWSLDAHAFICTHHSFICVRTKYANLYIVIDILLQIKYLGKFWFSSYGRKYCRSIKLQNSLKCDIYWACR